MGGLDGARGIIRTIYYVEERVSEEQILLARVLLLGFLAVWIYDF